MACISLPILDTIAEAQTGLKKVTDGMLSLSGDSCNLFGILGLSDLESGIHSVLGAVGNAMSLVNNAISQLKGILTGIVDTAVSVVNGIMDTILGGINAIAVGVGLAVGKISAMVDSALGLLGKAAGVSQLLACAGVVGQVLNLPSNVTDDITKVTGLLNGGTPVADIANAMIAKGKDDLRGQVTIGVSNALNDVADSINSSQDLINVNLSSLGQYSCTV